MPRPAQAIEPAIQTFLGSWEELWFKTWAGAAQTRCYVYNSGNVYTTAMIAGQPVGLDPGEDHMVYGSWWGFPQRVINLRQLDDKAGEVPQLEIWVW